MKKAVLWVALFLIAFWHGRAQLPLAQQTDSLVPVRRIELVKVWDQVPEAWKERFPELPKLTDRSFSEFDTFPDSNPSLPEPAEPVQSPPAASRRVLSVVPVDSSLRRYYRTPGFAEFDDLEAEFVEAAIEYGYRQLRSEEWFARAKPRRTLQYPKIFESPEFVVSRTGPQEYARQVASGRTHSVTVYGKSRILTGSMLGLNSLVWTDNPHPTLRRAEIVIGVDFLQENLRAYRSNNAYRRNQALRKVASVMIHEIAHSYAHSHPDSFPAREDPNLFINWLTEAVEKTAV